MFSSIRASWHLLPLLVFVIILTHLSREYLNYEKREMDVIAWGVFMSVMGILYAVVVGFVLVEALGRFASLDQTIDAEINAIQDIRDMLMYFNSSQLEAVLEVRRALRDYAVSVGDREWQGMADPSGQFSEFSSPEINQLIQATNKIKVEDANDSIALTAIIQQIASITTLRTRRIYHSDERIPPSIYTLIRFMSLILLSGLILMGVAHLWVQNLMVLSMTTAVFLAHKVLMDIDDPFTGSWSFSNIRYKRLIEEGLKA